MNNEQETPDNDAQLLTVSSADVLRLIMAHLTEAGLHQTVRTLQHESGVGLAGSPHSQQQWCQWAVSGQWALLLESLSSLDRVRAHLEARLVAEVHEMAILELAATGEWELSYATFRLAQHELDQHPVDPDDDDDDSKSSKNRMSLARLVEQKLAALASLRQKHPHAALPEHYYGRKRTKEQRREDLGQRLQDSIPDQPKNRLVSLLQHSIKWQVHTGQFPRIRQWWEDDEKEPQSSRKKKRRRKEFDLVLGQVSMDPTMVGQADTTPKKLKPEPVPSHPYSTIPFGKKATPEVALFLPDASGLVTGSSDGLIEIWDPAQQFSQLRMDLPYQQHEELLGHDQAVMALAVSADGTLLLSGSLDGTVQVWRLDTGKALRQVQAHNVAVTCCSFSPNSSHILVGSQAGTCREFGLRSARMLQEFRGHASYITACLYHIDAEMLLVVTASGDGTVRLWNGKSSETIRVLRPVSLGKKLSQVGSSVVVDPLSSPEGDGSPGVHTVIPLHTPANTIILISRGVRAFLVNFSGTVLRTYAANNAKGQIFVTGTVSPSNRSLYAVQDDGACCVFDIATGDLLQTIADFGSESTSRSKESKQNTELSSVIHHPTKHILAAFSNDKGQKRGKLVLWK